jgi:voltage-gated potassium channel
VVATRTRAPKVARIATLVVRRTAVPLALLLTVFVGGTAGYYLIGLTHDRGWSLADCAFMTSITLSTVGYGDVLGVQGFPLARTYTMLLIVTGLGTTLYSVSALTAFIVEGHLGRMFEEDRMEDRIARLTGHTIICGSGRTGRTVAEEHQADRRPFVIIERDEARLTELRATWPDLLVIVGDATNEDVLDRAGIGRAAALVAALSDDKANMFLVVTARYRKPDLRIVVKCLAHDASAKFLAAGASHVVSPSHIGGRRIAGHVLRPTVLDFLDSIVRRSDAGVGTTEILVEPRCSLDGLTLGDADVVGKVGLPIVALRHPGARHFVYAPLPAERLEPGTVLVVIGPAERVERLEALARA